MKNISLIFLSLSCLVYSDTCSAQKKSIQQKNELSISHDLSLPDWGPYTKKYIGVSHIPDVEKGIRFDLSIFPGFYRRKVEVPNVLFETAYHPWLATADLELFSFRHDLQWQDEVYADVAYLKMTDDRSRLIRMEVVNNTDLNQNLVMNFMASVHFPSIREYQPNTPIRLTEVKLPEGTDWIDATDYSDLQFATKRPSDNLVYDGKFRGEIRDHGLVSARGIGMGFGRETGDQVFYNLDRTNSEPDKEILLMRYRIKEGEKLSIILSGLVNAERELNGTGNLEILSLPVFEANKLITALSLRSKGGAELQIDGFVILRESQLEELEFKPKLWNPIPEIIDPEISNSIILKYKDIDQYYGISWDFDDYVLREIFAKDLDIFFRRATNEHVAKKLYGKGEGHYTNVFMRPITLEPNSKKKIYGQIHTGSLEEVRKALTSQDWNVQLYEQKFKELSKKALPNDYLPSAEPYLLGNQLMSATVATNVVYPVFTQKSYIRHRAPGRWWDCLYTWDSGFIGLGLLESDVSQAIDNLEAYLMEPGAQSAFLHHGTPVPVQHYLYNEIWNRSQSREFLKKYYPSLKRYHEFLAGRSGSSTTNTLKSGLLKTWDYFYNSGGWDDYPPQKYVHKMRMEKTTTPVVNTAHAIRTAKIMKQAAQILGFKKDIKAYDQDIKKFSYALQKYSWDQTSGYYGYVVHDENGEPKDILKTSYGENYNKGLGGAYPLMVGICNRDQQTLLLDHLKTKGKIWSDVGLSAVDQSASYYKDDGYWNGTVWMPHQWFFYKAMLDLGESEFAYQIAKTALDIWNRETAATYNCMEHFVIETGRGAGWHQFGALSSPVLSWFSSYYKKGSITTGYDFWITGKKFNDDFTAMEMTMTRSEAGKGKSTIVVVMKEGNYNVLVNGKQAKFDELHDGCLNIDVSNALRGVKIEIKKQP